MQKMQTYSNICKTCKLIQECAKHAKGANIYLNIFKNQQNPNLTHDFHTFSKPSTNPQCVSNLSRISHSTVRLRKRQCHLRQVLSQRCTVEVSKLRLGFWYQRHFENLGEEALGASEQQKTGGKREQNICAFTKKMCFFQKNTSKNRKNVATKKTSNKITAKIRKFNFCPKKNCLRHMFCLITHDMSEIGVNRLRASV